MERARHRKSKSASSSVGIRQTQKEKDASRLSTDFLSYFEGRNRNHKFILELKQNSSERSSGKPMKKLLAEEISKEVEFKRRSPSVIARLMGLEGMPSPRKVHRQQKRISDSFQPKNVSISLQKNSQLYDGRLNWRSSNDRQEFKDVYEDLEASHVTNRRCSSRWCENSILTKPEMALIRQKFIDAKRLSTDEKLLDSKELADTLEMLDSNKDLLLKFLQQQDSLFVKHSNDLEDDAGSSISSHIAVLQPSNTAKYESNSKSWRSERNASSKWHVAYLKREDGLLLEPHNRHRTCTSYNSSRIGLEEKNEERILPTRIVVLKPNLGKIKNDGTSGSLLHVSHTHQLGFKKRRELQSNRGSDTVSWTRKDPFHDDGFSTTISKGAREIAKEITMRMNRGYRAIDSLDTKSVRLKGYAGDESSSATTESDSETESEMFNLSSGKTFSDNEFCRYPSSHSGESSVSREAKKRLSERWKMTHKYQDLEMVSKGNTLGEMLSLSDRKTRPQYLNAKTSPGRPCDQLTCKNGTSKCNGPIGISTRDGWKDNLSRNSSRSRSLRPSTGGRRYKKSTYFDELAEDNPLRHGNSVHRCRFKINGNPVQIEDSPGDVTSRGRKPHLCQQESINEIDSLSEANTEIHMEANTMDLNRQQSTPTMVTKHNISRNPVYEEQMTAKPGSPTLSSESSKLLPPWSSSALDGDESAVHDQENSSPQELNMEPNQRDGSSSSHCLGAEPDSSEASKEADHSSPISVLEVPFTEDVSSSESFERVSAELHELRMQLQLLKMESSACDGASALVPIEEEAAHLSDGDHVAGPTGWETSYIIDVLIDSGLKESDFNMFQKAWHSPDCPVDPNLFDNLEKKYSDKTTGLRSERRLLFDRISTAISEMFNDHVDMNPWVMPKLGFLNLGRKDGIRDSVEKLLSEDFTFGEGSEETLNQQMQWSDDRDEVEAIGNEIERGLIDGMILELVCS